MVYDAYDFAGVRKGVEALPEDERQAERFCLEHADAIITKFPEETLDYYRKLGYRLPRKVLHQLDYCDDASWSPIDPDRPSPAEWHLVQGGTIAPASASREEFGYQQYHDIAESLAVQGLHFHLYPSPIQARRWADFECYRQLAARQPRFHFHRPVPFHQFCRELTKYDVGAWIHPRRAPQLTEHYWYGVGNKLTVYAEGGVAAAGEQRGVVWLAARAGKRHRGHFRFRGHRTPEGIAGRGGLAATKTKPDEIPRRTQHRPPMRPVDVVL